jgi:uncharacterized protein YndB with AHSA1/START domain
MTAAKTEKPPAGLELQYRIDAPAEKVWRAISIPEFRDIWLPREALATGDAISVTPGEEVSYRMRDQAPPFLESMVTFRILPHAAGGTILWIIHEPTDVRFSAVSRAAANDNGLIVTLAA